MTSMAFITSTPRIFTRRNRLVICHSPLQTSISRRGQPARLSAASSRPPVPVSVPAPGLNPPTPSKMVPFTFAGKTIHVPGRQVLTLVPILMASFIACAKLLYIIPVAISPSMFNALRLLVASLFFLPLLFRELSALRKPSDSEPKGTRFLSAGLELGALMFVANFLQIIGLRYTDASRAAFLQQLSTVLVPLAASVLGVEMLSFRVAMGALFALSGVAMLTLGAPAAVGAASLRWLGDGLELLSALFITIYMLRTSHHVKRIPRPGPIVAVKVVTQACLSFVWLAGRWIFTRAKGTAATATTAAVSWTFGAVAVNVLLVVWAGVFVSAATSWLQTKGQQAVPASETAILFAAQPLWASFIASTLFGERLGAAGMAGAGMIVAGTIVSGAGKNEGGE